MQVLVENPVLGIGALVNADNKITAVLGDESADIPIAVVFSPLIDQNIVILRCAEFVEIEFVKLILGRQGFALFGLIVTAVVEAAAILGPGGAAEFYPMDHVRTILSGVHLANAQLFSQSLPAFDKP